MALLVKVNLFSNKLAAEKDGFRYKSVFTSENHYSVKFDAVVIGHPQLRYGNINPNELYQVQRVSDSELIYVPYGAFSEFRSTAGSEGGSVESVSGDLVDNTDPANPVINAPVVTWGSVTEKPTTFAPSAHQHNASDINAGVLNIARVPTGTTATTVALGNHTHAAATTTVAGFMSTADKTKLDGIAAASVAPLAPGVAAVGTSALYARQDHVHPLQTTVSGNAGTATTLATGRTFSLTGGATGTSAAFNGSANASIPVTLATPTISVRGGVLQGEAVADATDEASAVTQLNAFLAQARAIGLIAS